MQADFDDSRLVPADSYLHAGYAVRERLFSGQGLVVEVHTREINHFLALPALAALDADLAGNPYVHSTRSWWRDFAAYFRTNPALNASLTADGLPTNPRNLFQWTQSFLATATGRQYLGDVVLSSSAITTTQVSTVDCRFSDRMLNSDSCAAQIHVRLRAVPSWRDRSAVLGDLRARIAALIARLQAQRGAAGPDIIPTETFALSAAGGGAGGGAAQVLAAADETHGLGAELHRALITTGIVAFFGEMGCAGDFVALSLLADLCLLLLWAALSILLANCWASLCIIASSVLVSVNQLGLSRLAGVQYDAHSVLPLVTGWVLPGTYESLLPLALGLSLTRSHVVLVCAVVVGSHVAHAFLSNGGARPVACACCLRHRSLIVHSFPTNPGTRLVRSATVMQTVGGPRACPVTAVSC